MKSKMILAGTASVAVCGTALAGNIVNVSGDISTSTTWTAGNIYNLLDQVYVRNGATLTIEPGTLIASTPTANGAGSLAITRGSKIIADGTAEAPIIFTSADDSFTAWREAANEWGNVTIMGNAVIGANDCVLASNTDGATGLNQSPMEGLVADFPGDPDVIYGGNDDNDDSGTLRYVSIRYGGRVVGLNNELNGLSLGAIGRETDIEYVEIMNNVDDGIEIWGGTVNLKRFAIWNIGDDSLDVDQGWRGKGQFGLIVQGYSLDASQGSGVGDNNIEMDGAEESFARPVTTTRLYNMTVIGQPFPSAGDGGVAYRDNARIQIRNSIFMELGERLVRADNVDGDPCGTGYGASGSHTWAATWTTPASTFPNWGTAPSNGLTVAGLYTAQDPAGTLNEISDSVFYNNFAADAYTASDAVGVTLGGASNPALDNVVVADLDIAQPLLPIQGLVRQIADIDGDGNPGVTKGGKVMLRVLEIDPRAANAAATSAGSAPADGFFETANYRGAFDATNNWLCGWSAADAFGFLADGSCPEPVDCPSDLDGSGDTGFSDLLILLAAYGQDGTGDLDGDGATGFSDLLILLAAYGPCP